MNELMEQVMEQAGIAGVVVLAVLIVVQLGLQITALLQLSKTPVEQVSLGGRKWAWLLIILLGEIAGAILWFVIGRNRTMAGAVGPAPDAQAQRSAVDALYGPPKGQ